MTLNCTWRVTSLEAIPEIAGQQNIVSKVNWILDANNGTQSYAITGTELLEYNPDAPFVQYEALTEAAVLGWVFASMGPARKQELVDLVTAKLEELSTPKARVLSPPWIPVSAGPPVPEGTT